MSGAHSDPDADQLALERVYDLVGRVFDPDSATGELVLNLVAALSQFVREESAERALGSYPTVDQRAALVRSRKQAGFQTLPFRDRTERKRSLTGRTA